MMYDAYQYICYYMHACYSHYNETDNYSVENEKSLQRFTGSKVQLVGLQMWFKTGNMDAEVTFWVRWPHVQATSTRNAWLLMAERHMLQMTSYDNMGSCTRNDHHRQVQAARYCKMTNSLKLIYHRDFNSMQPWNNVICVFKKADQSNSSIRHRLQSLHNVEWNADRGHITTMQPIILKHSASVRSSCQQCWVLECHS